MIHVDEHGNRFIRMAGDGALIPLESVALQIRVETVSHGQIMGVDQALSIERTAAAHWYAKWVEAQSTIADLRAQLSNGG